MIGPIPDATTTETQLTLMTKRRAFSVLIVWALVTLLSIIVSFAPTPTIVKTGHSIPTATALNKLDIRLQFDGYTSMSSTAIFTFVPTFTQSSVDRNIELTLKGTATLLDYALAEITSIPIDEVFTFSVKSGVITGFTPEHFLTFSRINFNSITISAEATVSHSELQDIIVTSISIGQSLTITGIVFISIYTVIVSLLLVFIISKRVRPAHLDHWLVIILSGVLIVVDGPWLLCQHFGFSSFSRIFDMAPQIFHAFFVLYAFAFFSVRARNPAKKIYKNKVIYICVILFILILLILQFTVTSGNPLATFALYRKDHTAFVVVLVILFLLYHGSIIFGFVYGFIKLQFEKLLPMLIIAFTFCSLEATQIVAFFSRLFVGQEMVGVSMAADIFYILEANLVTFVLLYVDTPVSQAADGTNRADNELIKGEKM
ncbi:hypothetical protein GPJ56_010194 [Histomonas meleagridis]|uniref:uncharacterized protein n=1 Tax=Histomonas meleagridis TaxID=135588 RepID=UPI00355A1FC0|nr:hypothetical protein GPJ56_010194 [Histomonas meleagridis]KAH0804730.1 hypothetical protein GO595_002424 [Histomonas meleagridis]